MLGPALFLALQLVGPTGRSPAVRSDRLLVELGAPAPAASLRTALAEGGCSLRLALPQIGWAVVDVHDRDVTEARDALLASGRFPRVLFDRVRRIDYVPNDPMWSQMWQLPQMRCDEAWDVTRGIPSVVLAVLDTGIEASHPDLSANLWTNPGEIAGNGIDDDGNGYIDDLHGYDFVALDGTPEDVNGHGTEVAGISSAVQDNAIGITGTAPLCPVAVLKTGTDAGLFYDSAIVPALVYAADMGFRVAVMSFSGDGVTPAERAAVEYARRSGVLLVASAGNDSSVYPFYPAAYDGVIAVGATQNSQDQRAFFSNHGSWVDMAAPGFGIRTTTLGGGYTSSFSGTSGSAPYVAGIGALLFSRLPGARVARVRAALEDSALLLSATGYGFWSSYGRADARTALDRLVGIGTAPVAARMAFLAPSGGTLALPPRSGSTRAAGVLSSLVLHGVGLEAPARLVIRRNGRAVPLLDRTRNRVEFSPGRMRAGDVLTFQRDGQTFDSLRWDAGPGRIYAVTDAGTRSGGVALGGFSELARDDGNLFTCTRNAASQVLVEAIVRGIEEASFTSMTLEATRSYTNAAGATETIELYDWSSGSYPGGSWVTVSTRSLPSSPTTEILSIPIPAPVARFVDDTGTVYLRSTATPVTFGGQASIDRLRLRVQ